MAAYRDCFRLLFEFARDQRKNLTESLMLADLDAPLVLAFLDHLEKDRNNSIRSRNARLAAVRSFLRFAALKNPEALAMIQRALAIPMKRCTRPLVGFLSREEVQAIISAPNPTYVGGSTRSSSLGHSVQHWSPRVGGDVGIKVADVTLEGSPSIRLHGKGRKDRVRAHLAGHCGSDPALARTNRCCSRQATVSCSQWRPTQPFGDHGSLEARHENRHDKVCQPGWPQDLTAHVSTHNGNALLQSGVDIAVIALWLGHESPTTTHIYIEADLKMKEAALKVIKPPALKGVRYQPPKGLLGFLQSL